MNSDLTHANPAGGTGTLKLRGLRAGAQTPTTASHSSLSQVSMKYTSHLNEHKLL